MGREFYDKMARGFYQIILWFFVFGCVVTGIIFGIFYFFFYPEQREPCFRNLSDVWLYSIAQSELNDKDYTPEEKQYHDAVKRSFSDTGELFVDSITGYLYVVPGFCEVDEKVDFFGGPTMWRK